MAKTLRMTKCCFVHGHPEFRIIIDPAVTLEADAAWFLAGIEESVTQGTRYSAGQTCLVGWMVTQIRQTQDGDLTFWEPDMVDMPVEWEESVSRTLALLRTQKDVVESVLPPEELSFPSLQQLSTVCTRFARTEDLVFVRTQPEGIDSGWFFGCSDDDHDHNEVSELKGMSLYEVVVKWRTTSSPVLGIAPRCCRRSLGGNPSVLPRWQATGIPPWQLSCIAARL